MNLMIPQPATTNQADCVQARKQNPCPPYGMIGGGTMFPHHSLHIGSYFYYFR
jgi:hypothetical protein